MFKLMEQIAFEMTKKFHVSVMYKQVCNAMRFYFLISDEPQTFYLYIAPDGIEVDVDLFRFDPCAETNNITLSGEKKVRDFLHEMLYRLETSDTWEEFVKQLYYLNY